MCHEGHEVDTQFHRVSFIVLQKRLDKAFHVLYNIHMLALRKVFFRSNNFNIQLTK